MRDLLCGLSGSIASALLLASSGCATSAPLAGQAIPNPSPVRTVYLDTPASLARLRAENPIRYALVQRILTSFDTICAPGPLTLRQTETAHGPGAYHCESMLLMTSYPPKRQVSFTLDNTRYVAQIVLTHDQPHVMRAWELSSGQGRQPASYSAAATVGR